MIPSVADIRASGDGYADFSDYEVLQAAYPAYQRYYPDFTEFAKAAGTNPGGLTGNRLGAGVDNYQAGLYGVGEAVAGAVGADSAAGWLGQRRVSNESQARGQTQFARDQGAVESFREVDGVGSGLNYLGGLAAQSLPYLGEAVVGGMVARGLMSGTRAALTGAKTVEEAAAATRALNMGSSAGAVAASYPSAVGDILQNQREEAGTTDLGSAMVGGVPYAALNAIGVEGMAARGLRGIGGTGTSRLRNAAYEGGKSLLAEGASETGQELVNQSFGRMAVNPDQALFNPEANERYLESFVGGAALGGVAGGVSGLRQRPKPTVEEQPNLLDRATDRPDFDLQSYGQGEGPLQGAPVVGEDFGSLNSDLGEAIAMAEAAQKSGDTAGLEFANKAILQLSAQVRALEPTRVQGGQRTLMSGVHEMVSGQPIELTNDELGQGTMPFVPPGVDTGLGLSLGGAPVQQGMDFEYQDINPLQEGVGNSPGQNAPVQSPQAVAVKAVAEKAAQARKAALTDLVDMTPDGQPAVKVNPRALQAHTQMSELRDAGVMTQAALEESLGTLREAIAAEDTKTINAVAKQAQENYSAFKNPQPAAAQAPAVVSRGNAPAVGAASQTVAGIGPNQTTTVGRKGRAKQVTAGQLLDMFANATPREAATLRLATGLESDTDPTTGKPIMLPTGENPLSNPEIATKLQELGFGVIGSAGVQATLTKFNVTPAVVDAVNATSVDAVSEAELGLDQAGGTETAGLRVEDTMSKATGQGLVEGGNENREQRRSRAGADIILRDGGVSEKVAEMFPGERAQAPQAVAVPDPKQAVTDLREGNAAVVAQNVQRILATQEYQLAAADWFGQQYTIDQLPDTLKADWFEIYSDTLDKYDQEWNADVESELTAAAQSIERDADILTGGPQTAQLGQATGVEVEPVGGNESAAGGAQSTEGRTAPTVKVKKKRTVVRDATDVTAKPEQTTENGQTVAGETTTKVAKGGVAYADDIKTATRQLGTSDKGGDTGVSGGSPAQRESRTGGSVQGKRAGTEPAVRKYSASQLAAEISAFVRAGVLGRNVHVVQSLSDLPAHVDTSKLDGTTQGVTITRENGRYAAYLIADNIEVGSGRAVFLHEVGVHIGLERLLTPEQFKKLAEFVISKSTAYAEGRDNTAEGALAERAVNRARAAGVDLTNSEMDHSETVAYFVEEAVLSGVDPTATNRGPFSQWFRTLWAAFKSALHRLGVNTDKVTAQDVVDMAYGAARLEMAGTYHGTAANFRRFDHRFMNTGEGAQAYGWGSYLAQRFGVAKGYWKDDVGRKTPPRNTMLTWGDGTAVSEEDKSDLSAVLDNDFRRELSVYSRIGDRLDANWRSNAKTLLADRAEILAKEEQRVSRIRAAEAEFALADAARNNRAISFDALMGAQEKLFRAKREAGFKAFGYERAVDEARVLKKVLAAGLNLDTGAPAGSLMRVDVGVMPDEMLDWDSRIGEQPFILNQVGSYMPKSLLAAVEEEANLDLAEMTGEDLYRALQYLENRESVVSEMFSAEDFNARLQGAGAKQIVSTYLDEQLGVRALKFWDRSSRKASADRTKNIVVFNDKNLFRVGSMSGAERSKMQFSKSAPATPSTPKLKLSTKLEKFAHKHMGMTVAKMVRDAATLAANGARSMQFLGDIVDTHKARMPALKAWYDKFNDIQAMRRELEESAETIVAMTSKLKSTKRLSDFIAASTLSQKWGYDPVKVHGVKAGEGQVVDAPMRVEFNKLWPEEKAVVQAVFQHGIDTVNKRDEIMRALKIDTSVFSPTGRLVGPYAPLKRFGDHVAVLKSKELLAAETAGDTQRVEALKESPDHYMVSSFDTAGQAYEFAYQNDAANGGTFAFTDNFAQKERVDSVRSMPEKVLQKVMGHIDTNKALDAKGMEGAKEAVQKLVRDMYANAIEEKSARAAGLKRLNRAGFESDMLRSFLANARANASFLANMRHGAEANAEFYKFQQESRNADTGKHDMMDVVNTVTQHYQKSMEYKDTPVQNFVLALTSVMQLALSPAYHIANATQPLMVTAPRLAADFSDYSGAVRHLKDGYNLLKTTGVWGQLNLKGVKDAGLRGALERASRAGLLDVGMDEDMSHLERFTTGYKAADTATSAVQKTIHKLRQISRSVEAANRVSTAYAAYTMHLANNTGTSLSAAEKVEQAQEYASKVLRETQGDFSMNGAPLLLKKLPRLVTQYRKYQFMMGAVYVKAFQQAFAGSSPTEKALGRRMLGYMLGHAAVAGGALGLPLVNVVGMVFAALGDPDEPKDLERTLREAIGDETMANALLHGPLSWLGLDGKLSQANIFAVMPYTDVDMSSKSGIATTVMGLAGPSFAQVTKMALGVGKMAEGDYVKGVEGVMPSGISNAVKAFRIANEGYTMSNGDVMFKPEDINGLEMFLDGLGLRSNEMKRMQWLRGQQYEIDRFFKERTGEVTKAYVRAIKDGDMGAAAEARDDWSTLQANKDGLRKYFGDSHAALKRQPLSTLLKAPQEQKRREAKLQATVPQ